MNENVDPDAADDPNVELVEAPLAKSESGGALLLIPKTGAAMEGVAVVVEADEEAVSVAADESAVAVADPVGAVVVPVLSAVSFLPASLVASVVDEVVVVDDGTVAGVEAAGAGADADDADAVDDGFGSSHAVHFASPSALTVSQIGQVHVEAAAVEVEVEVGAAVASAPGAEEELASVAVAVVVAV